MKPFFRPQRKQRRTILEENFGVLFALATTDVFAIYAEIKIKALVKALGPMLSRARTQSQITPSLTGNRGVRGIVQSPSCQRD